MASNGYEQPSSAPGAQRARTQDASDPDEIQPVQNLNPFATPSNRTPSTESPFPSGSASRSQSTSGQISGSASSSGVYATGSDVVFRSRRIKKGNIQRPWLAKKDPREKWVTIIPVMGILLGLIVSGILIWDGLRTVSVHKYCEVLNDDFSFWDPRVWNKEVEVGGFGNGQFEMTTNTEENVFVENGMLNIRPTLQDPILVETDNVLDLRGVGCTGTKWTDCVTSTNTTNGTIINPVKSGRINTRLGPTIRFGRVEVTAKLSQGDWLWPAIWMLPVNSVYGEWPRSGEIDIMESRGNNYSYEQGGNNIISSTLHFGPNEDNDGWWRNNVKRKAILTTYSAGFHTFGVEWSEKYIFTYVDNRLMQVMFTNFAQPFWEYGLFPPSDANGTRLENPWAATGSKATPFDQDFYLVINVAVGGTNGWFKDGKSSKPWVDRSPSAKKDFWQTREHWYPTWHDGGAMQVKNVRMWQQAGYNGCDL